ncbi:MAG: hypothetical protein JWP12_2058 [Bacteroidetes bacterium]|nr:hypothetical protein [Bacteroidota bacterium]
MTHEKLINHYHQNKMKMKTGKHNNKAADAREKKLEEEKSFEKAEEKYPYHPKSDYPESDDLFSREKEAGDLNPEDLSETKAANLQRGELNEKDFKTRKTASDLDIPGSELDDEQEEIGSEDEENNYYSLGGDDHDN